MPGAYLLDLLILLAATVEEPLPAAPIVLAGFGRVGRRIGDILARAERPFVALDADPVLVARARSGDTRSISATSANRGCSDRWAPATRN